MDQFGKIVSGNYVASLRPGEKYRYGIILYDDKGRRSSVRHIGDVDVPEWNIITIANEANGYKYEVTPICVRVTFLQDIPNCSGYEIVRCIKGINESKVLYQGILGCPVGHGTELSTPAFLSRSMLYPCSNFVKTDNNVVIFACPECVYLPEETKNRMSSLNTRIKSVVDYKIPLENAAGIICGKYSKYPDQNLHVNRDGYWGMYANLYGEKENGSDLRIMCNLGELGSSETIKTACSHYNSSQVFHAIFSAPLPKHLRFTKFPKLTKAATS